MPSRTWEQFNVPSIPATTTELELGGIDHLFQLRVAEARLRPQDDGLPSLGDLIEVSFQGLDGAAVSLRGLLQLLERFLLSP